jgi:WD40 repeat protein/tRNA A-37 threonylcarbamoyl transferase component Bud32/Tfp pilus assembly protein PilF
MVPNMSDAARDQRLEEIVLSYLQAVDAGQSFDRDAILAKHPDLAGELRDFFADEQKMDRLVKSLHKLDAGDATIDEVPTPPAIEEEGALPRIRYFGDYELIEEIARGGMGVVYKARQVSLNRLVALKMILRGELAKEEDVRRFRTEAEAAANLDHPHIVPIYEVGEHEGQQYFSMKLIERGTWRPGTGQRDTVQMVARVSRAVHHAHQRGILHRDLKPGNVLIDRQAEPHVADFGLAKRVEADSSVTRSGVIVGTPSYMAPEQARAEKVLTTAVDVYSLGAILYEWLTGRPPFRGDDVVSTLLKVTTEEPARPRSIDGKIDRDLETICLKCLEKDPAKRYGSAEALADDLDRWLRGEPITARPVGRLERSWRWCRRNPLLAASLLIVALSLVTSVIVQAVAYYRVAAALDATEQARKNEEAERERAEENADEARKRLARQYVSNAVRVMDEGDLFGALPWLAEAIRQDEGKPEREAMHRLRFGSVLSECPRLTQLWFPPADVMALGFFGDGLRAIVGEGKKVQVWDALSGEPLSEPLLHPFPAQFAAFSPDGARVLIGVRTTGAEAARDHAFYVWDIAGSKKVCTLEPTGTASHEVRGQFTPDGKRILAELRWQRDRANVAGEAGIWDAETGKRLTPTQAFTVFTESLSDVGERNFISKDSRQVVTLGQQGIVVWDAHTGKAVSPTIAVPLFGACHADFSPDGKLAAFEDLPPGGVGVWDIASGKGIVPLLKCNPAVHVAFRSDGRSLSAMDIDSTRWTWQLDHPQQYALTASPHAPKQQFNRVPWISPNGIHTAVALDKHVALWNLATRQPLGPLLRHEDAVRIAVFDRDGTRLATTGKGMPVRVFDIGGTVPSIPGREFLAMSQWDKGQTAETMTEDGKRALFRVWPEASQLWDLETEKPMAPPQYGQGLSVSDLTPERSVLLERRDRADQRVEFIATNMVTGKHVRIVGERSADAAWPWPLGMVTENGRWIILEGIPTGTGIWDAETGRHVVTLQPQAYRPTSSPDGRMLVAFDKEGRMRAWSIPVGKLLWSTPPFVRKLPWPHNWHEPDVQFSQASQLVVVTWHEEDNPETLNLGKGRFAAWDLATGQRRFDPVVLPSHFVRHCLSRDGQRFFALDGDNNARLWNARTGEPLNASWKPDATTDVAFNDDGTRIVLSSTSTAETRVWDPVRGKPLGPPLAGTHVAHSPDASVVLVYHYSKDRPWYARLQETETGLPLTPRWTGLGNHVHFQRDGKQITTLRDQLVYKRTLSVDERSITDLKAIAGALSRYQIDETGGFVFMDRPDFEKAWQSYRARRLPSDLAFTPRQRREWHAQAAVECLNAAALDGALHHLDILLRQEPDNALLHFMKARAYQGLANEDKAIAALTQAIASEPRCRKLWEDRGWLHLQRSDPARAAVDFARVIEIGTDDFSYWRHLALLYLVNGKQQEYVELCNKIFDRQKAEAIFDVQEVLPTLAWQPRAIDPARLLALVPAEQTAAEFVRRKLLAIAHYRAGKYADAAANLHRALKEHDNLQGADLVWAALIFHQAGRLKDAQAYRIRAETWRNKEGKTALWIQRAEFDHLFRELTEVSKGKSVGQ